MFRRPNYQRGVLLTSASAIEGHIEVKTPQEFQQRGLVLARQSPAHRSIATQKELIYLGFQCLDRSTYSLDLALSDHRLPPGLKQIESSPFFVRRVGDSCRRDLVGRTIFWIFLCVLQKWDQRVKKCVELRGEYVEKIANLVAVACFFPGRTNDLSTPLVGWFDQRNITTWTVHILQH